MVELLARAVVGLHQHTEHAARADAAARGADAALEAVRHHARATADIALGHRPGPCRVERLEYVGLRDVLAETVVQEGIGGLADDRLMPRNLAPRDFVEPAVHGIADHAHRIGPGDHHRTAQHPALDHPWRSGHLAEAVAGEPARRRPAATSCPAARIAVTPVRTGPRPTTSGPRPSMSVVCPTSTPATSVIALSGPGVPANGTPRSRARGLVCASIPGAGARTGAAIARIRSTDSSSREVAHGGYDAINGCRNEGPRHSTRTGGG